MVPRSWDPNFGLRSRRVAQSHVAMVGQEVVADLEVAAVQGVVMDQEMVSGRHATVSVRLEDQEDTVQVVEAAAMALDPVPVSEGVVETSVVAHGPVSVVAATPLAQDQVSMDLQVGVDAVSVDHGTQDGQVELAGADASDQDRQLAEAAFKCTI